MSTNTKVKQGYMKKYAKGIIGNSWKKIFVDLDKSGKFSWFKKKKSESSGSVILSNVREYFTVGSYCRAIPFSPELPSYGKLENMFAFPEEPNKKSKVHFFSLESDFDFKEWISAIISTFPTFMSSNETQNQQCPTSQLLPQNTNQPIPAFSAYSPSPYSQFPVQSHPATNSNYYGNPSNQWGPLIGFEGLTISNSSYPVNSGTQQTQFYPAQYSQPYPQQIYPQQREYLPQSFANQPSPYLNPYNSQQMPVYTGQQIPNQPYNPSSNPAYLNNHSVSQNNISKGGQSFSQVIIVEEKNRNNSGMENFTAGALGGALAGYAASRMIGGYGGDWGYSGWRDGYGGWGECLGHGTGWGRGSWGSCSWSSRSWGSFSSGSWG